MFVCNGDKICSCKITFSHVCCCYECRKEIYSNYELISYNEVLNTFILCFKDVIGLDKILKEIVARVL